MDSIQKERISYMRQEGVGYSKIARTLGISENTVKSYCKRNHLGGQAAVLTANVGSFCKSCGMPIEQPLGKKERKFCSDECRIRWWNTHPEHVKKEAIYHFNCAHCGSAFESYGNKSRKFCSHACYISNRFGVREAGDRV